MSGTPPSSVQPPSAFPQPSPLTRRLLVSIRFFALATLTLSLPCALAQQPEPPVALTIYNQDFAVARTSVDLDLHPGLNEVTATQVTSRLEPDSVILRDPSGKRTIDVVEQNYDAAVVSQEWLLQKYEGKTIDFQVQTPQGPQIVQGRILRAGFYRPNEITYDQQQIAGVRAEPLIEVNGKMQFQLPGLPLFPSATDGLLLKPTLRWQIQSEKPEHFAAELAYITGGLDWDATYNIVVPNNTNVAADEKADVLGWVTIHNLSGTDFPAARIKLMAGDIAKIRNQPRAYDMVAFAGATQSVNVQPGVTQKPFDDFHLYDLHRTVALHDGETKQVQFLDVSGVTVHRSYVYSGASTQLQPEYYGNINQQQGYGLDNDNTQVRIEEEIKNSTANHLGMPLPAGRMRLYRRDADGQMEFVGENLIRHTPAEQTVRLITGAAFDIKGSRRQTDFNADYQRREIHESFEIRVTNQKDQPVDVTIVERLYRGVNWEILSKSSDYTKRDSQTIEFPVTIPAKGESTVTYTVRYTW